MKLAEIFALDRSKLNWSLGLMLAGTMVIPLVVLAARDQEVYWVSVWFGVLFVGLSDPGGAFAIRASRLTIGALLGAVLTVWAVAVGDEAWWLVALSAFAVTLAAGLSIRFGVRRFVAGALLNVWFIIAISLVPGFAASDITLNPWSQALAWLAGAALWLVLSTLVWLARRRPADAPPPFPELPTDTTGRELTPPVVVYSVIRALVLGGTVAFAFGQNLPYADWMPLAALVAMRTDLRGSTQVAAQRVVGTILGAVIAIVFLLGVDSRGVLALVILVLAVVGGALRSVNYAIYTAAMAGAALIALDIANPTNLTTEGQRILFTLTGVAIAVVVMLLVDLLAKRSASRHAGAATA